MNADTEYPQPRVNRFTNQLPATFRTWLEFYDSIPVELRELPELRTVIRMDRRTFEELTGEGLGRLVEGQAAYTIEREYLLARIGEELLPSRLAKKDVNELERALCEAGRYSPHSFAGAVNLLTPIWAVARDK